MVISMTFGLFSVQEILEMQKLSKRKKTFRLAIVYKLNATRMRDVINLHCHYKLSKTTNEPLYPSSEKLYEVCAFKKNIELFCTQK